MTVSVLFPTTGRPQRARDCLRNLHDSIGTHPIEVVAAVDGDRETAALIEPFVDQILYSDEFRGCSNAWNDCLRACTGDPVVFAADDLVWEFGWVDAALAALKEFDDGWGLVGFNDSHWGPELSTHYLMSRRFIVEVLGGVVAWPWYRHSFNDLEVNERAKRAGRYVWCEKAHVRHLHWTYGDRECDATDTRFLGEHEQAERTYRQREQAGFPNNYRAVITA